MKIYNLKCLPLNDKPYQICKITDYFLDSYNSYLTEEWNGTIVRYFFTIGDVKTTIPRNFFLEVKSRYWSNATYSRAEYYYFTKDNKEAAIYISDDMPGIYGEYDNNYPWPWPDILAE
jgi:hypothetical protein